MCRPYLFQEGLDEQQRNQGTKVSNNSLFLRDFVVKIQAVRVISTNYNLLSLFKRFPEKKRLFISCRAGAPNELKRMPL
jgi:hypothetical protein